MKEQEIIRLFSNFSDKDFQRRSWFGIGPEASSPDEMCNRIDDLFLIDWVKSNQIKIGENLSNYIYDFLNDIDNLPKCMDPWTCFCSQEWIKIRLKSSIIRDVLLEKIYN